MKNLHIITPVKDSIESTIQTIRALLSSSIGVPYTYTVYNDFSTPENTALLEMLNTVYVHNKNLPQGVKDLIVLQYVNCQKALSNDELLRQVVESVREKINAEAVTEDEKQD